MKISLVGWKSHGMRCPDLQLEDLDGGADGIGQVTLIQMPNGTGKTTTLELINATLSGEARDWDDARVRGYRRKMEHHAQGTFAVTLRVDGKLLTIELTLDFETGDVVYRTTRPGSGGVLPGYDPPPGVRRFLTSGFLNLFVFDGEFAERLFNPRMAEADDAVDALCQLYLLDEVTAFAEAEWDRRTKQVGAKTDTSLTRFTQQRNVLTERRTKVVEARAAADAKAKTAEAELADLQGKIDTRMTTVQSIQGRYSEALVAVTRTEGSLATATANVMQSIRQPLSIDSRFGNALLELKNNLDELELPANTSAQFFLDLLNQKNCICGREMNDGAKLQIEINASQVLGSEEAGIINAMKKDIGDYAVAPADDDGISLEDLLGSMGKARREARAATQSVNALKQKLIAEGDEELRGWQEALGKHRDELAKCLTAMVEIDAERDDRPDSSLWSLKIIDKKIEDLGRRIAEITHTVTLRKQTDQLRKIMSRARDLAKRTIKDELVAVCNERLGDVLRNDPVRIERIDRSIRLADQERGSTGQNLAIGYVFLTAALNRGSNDFPLVVDSPANPFDAGRRRRIGALIPDLCSQFVGFIINTEFLGFVQSLEDASTGVRFITIFRRTPGTERLIPDLPADTIQTSNAVVTEDRAYFLEFDMTEEED